MAAVEWDLLADLEPGDRRNVLATAVRRRYRRGDTLFHEGDPADTLHLVAKGRVLVRVLGPTGEDTTLDVLGPGQAFGEQALIEPDRRRTASAVAAEPTETLTLHVDAFRTLLRDHPEVQSVLVRILAARVRRLTDQVRDALFVAAETRVLRTVVTLADVYDDGGDGPVTIRLTQTDVASLAGTARPTANRALQRAVDADAIRLGRGRIEVVDRDTLAALAR